MLEDGNSTPQLAHIIIVRNPTVFRPYSSRFVGYMINSLHQLGLPQSCPQENRVLTVDVVSLLLEMERTRGQGSSGLISAEQVDTIANFLVRLKILMAEPGDGRSHKIDVSALTLDSRASGLLTEIVAKWAPEIRSQPFEKVVAKDKSIPVPLFSCLDILSALIGANQFGFFIEHSSVVSDIVSGCFTHARDDSRLRDRLRNFVLGAAAVPSLGSLVVVPLEKIIVDVTHEQKKSSSSPSTDTSRQGAQRSRDKSTATDDNSVLMGFALFAIELLAELCRKDENCLKKVAHVFLSLASSLTKSHLLDAATKQRQGSSMLPVVLCLE